MTRSLFLAAGVVLGFLLAHLVAYVGPRLRGWLREWNERKWLEEFRRRGVAFLRVMTRQARRVQQREYARGLARAAASKTALSRRDRRTAEKLLVRGYRHQAKKQQREQST